MCTDSFIARIGGKKLLRKIIIENFPQNVERYVEVFGGAAWVLLYKEPSKIEIYNDLDRELVNLFKIVKFHLQALKTELENLYTFCSRELFENCLSQLKIGGLTDIQRAARFLITIRYSSRAKGKNFFSRAANFDNLIEKMDKFQERFKKVIIEHLNYNKLINIYDKSDTLFYLDPPYFGTEKYYIAEFT
jgi:DNA adenine methylase